MATNIRGLLLILFLYLGLALAVNFYQLREFNSDFFAGFALWAIVGLTALLALVIAAWLFGMLRNWWRQRPVRTRAQEAPSSSAEAPEVTQLKALMREASAQLARSSKLTSHARDGWRLSGLPLYLVVGPEGGGKTSVMLNSAMEAELLAGQAGMDRVSPAPTSLANIWFAGGAIFTEIGGRHFTEDSTVWEDLLKVLASGPKVSIWQRIRRGRPQGLQLKGVLHCFDLGFFVSAPGADLVEQQSKLTNERLKVVSKIFRRPFPVYTLFTKSDHIPYFREFFGRLSDWDAGQILGCTLPSHSGGADHEPVGFVERETKRVSAELKSIYLALAERRVSFLFHEPKPENKPKIYEFPREFTRFRSNVAAFLGQSFRPSNLVASPVNRGFYFIGTREGGGSHRSPASSGSGVSGVFDANVTQVFRGDVSRVFQGDSASVSLGSAGPAQMQWLFLNKVFSDIVLEDPLRDAYTSAPKPGFRLESKGVAIAGLAIAGLALFVWTVSFFQNRGLIRDVEGSMEQVRDIPETVAGWPTVDQLAALDQLREDVDDLSNDRVPLRRRWGLYTGNGLRTGARQEYFSTLQRLLLVPVNTRLREGLDALGRAPVPGNPRDWLRAYVMTSGGGDGCVVDAPLVAEVFMAVLAAEGFPPSDAPLARRQIDFYARELGADFSEPARLAYDASVRDSAVDYLNADSDDGNVLRQILDGIERELGAAERIEAEAAGYNELFNATSPVAAAYTPAAARLFVERLRGVEAGQASYSCVPELQVPTADLTSLDEVQKGELQANYARAYRGAWQTFLEAQSLQRFRSASDAADRLQRLADFNSPMLALLRFTGTHTIFDDTSVSESNMILRDAGEIGGGSLLTLEDVEDAFAPVRLVVDPDSSTLDNDVNKPYTTALMMLANTMETVAEPGGRERAQSAVDAAEGAVRAVSGTFPTTSPDDVAAAVNTLLRSPIDEARRLIPADPLTIRRTTYEQQLGAICQQARSVLDAYPFNRSSGTDASLVAFNDLFARGGRIWTAPFVAALTVPVENGYQANPSSELQPADELIRFLNRVRQITDLFFTADGGVLYTLRPSGPLNNRVVALTIDGQSVEWGPGDFVLQQDFTWPGAAGSQRAEVTVGLGQSTFTTDQSGPWAVFKIVDMADRVTENVLEWRRLGSTQIDPPLRLELVQDGNGWRIFDPGLLDSLSCPARATR